MPMYGLGFVAMTSIRTKRNMFARLTSTSAIPARLMGLRSSIRRPCLASTVPLGDFSSSMFSLRDFFFVLGFGLPEGAVCFVQCLAVQSVFLLVVVQWHFSVPPGPVHRVNIGIQKYLVKVPHYDRQRRQYSFVIMNRGCYIQPPPRQMIADAHFGPQRYAGYAHHDHAPDQSPVFRFFCIVKAGELWLLRAQSYVVGEILPRAADIIHCWEQIDHQAPAFPGQDCVEDVIKADTD